MCNREYNVPWARKSLHPEQNLDPLSHFCRAPARDTSSNNIFMKFEKWSKCKLLHVYTKSVQEIGIPV